jgi:DICT domain-containing protein
MTNNGDTDAAGLLPVGELARRSGVAAATLRTWEARYGFPTPVRGAGGHRRYDPRLVGQVAEVARLRRAGLSVPAAVDAARRTATPPPRSFVAALRSAGDGLTGHVLGKRTLGAVTTAVEDECLARASRPVLIGAFQRARFYRQSAPRWEELARTSGGTVVFADFEAARQRAGHPSEVPLAADSPVRREWALVCDADGFSAGIAGWELPSPPGTADRDRRFETVWTLDPRAVREATRVGISLLEETDPELSSRLSAALPEVVEPASPDLRRATSLLARIVSYATDVGDGPGTAS